jgi:hypothetical protein
MVCIDNAQERGDVKSPGEVKTKTQSEPQSSDCAPTFVFCLRNLKIAAL